MAIFFGPFVVVQCVYCTIVLFFAVAIKESVESPANLDENRGDVHSILYCNV